MKSHLVFEAARLILAQLLSWPKQSLKTTSFRKTNVFICVAVQYGSTFVFVGMNYMIQKNMINYRKQICKERF